MRFHSPDWAARSFGAEVQGLAGGQWNWTDRISSGEQYVLRTKPSSKVHMRKSLENHFFLVVLFVSLFFVGSVLFCTIHFAITRTAQEGAASDATRRISRELLAEVEKLLAPAQMAIKQISHSALVEARTVDERLAQLPLVRDTLETSPTLQSLYLGYADGSIFQITPVPEKADRAAFHAPAQAAYLVRSVERADGMARGRLYFLDVGLTVIHVVEAPDFVSKFDPGQRPAHTRAAQIRMEPYPSTSEREAGYTLAMPSADRGAVVAGDIRMESLGQMLARNKTTPHSILALLDGQGRINAIGRSTPESGTASDAMRRDALAATGDYDIQVLGRLAAGVSALGREGSGRRQETIATDGRNWNVSIDWLTPTGGKPLFLVSAVPQDELLEATRQRAWMGIGAAAAITLLSLPILCVAARHNLTRAARFRDGVTRYADSKSSSEFQDHAQLRG